MSPVCSQPLRKASRRFFRMIVVALHHVRAAHDDLADLFRRAVRGRGRRKS